MFAPCRWYAVQFDDFHVERSSSALWNPARGCAKPSVGTPISADDCPRNANFTGTEDVQFTLVATTWQLLHDASGLCVETDSDSMSLQKCDSSKSSQQFRCVS